MTSESDLSQWRFLASDRGQEQLAALSSRDTSELRGVGIVSALRKRGLSTDEASAVLSQSLLQRKATLKFGQDASQMLFTEAGLEQATRAPVAQLHAQRYAIAGLSAIADLGCGIGAESRAFASIRSRVMAVELDSVTAFVAQHNLRTFPEVSVTLGDAERADLGSVQAVFLDPARRTRGHKETSRLTRPSDYSPSIEFAYRLAEQLPLGIKLGPGFERSEIPERADAQWTSVNGEAVEMMLWFGALRRAGHARSAVILRNGEVHEMSADADAPDAEVGELGTFLFEPDPAIIRARLIGDLARTHGLAMVHEHIAYLTGDTLHHTPFAQVFRVIDVLPAGEHKLKKALRARNIGSLEIKKRGMDVDPATLRARLALRGDESATLILTRVGTNRVAILAERL